jgi:2-hydroxychromene-2-carboxylate isomerase
MPRLTLPIYIDYKSPYAYLATGPAYDLEKTHDITIDWRPYTLNIPIYLGNVDNRNDHQWRRVRYSYMDARRIANQRGITVLGPQKIFNSRPVHTAMLYAKLAGCLRAFQDPALELFWKRQLDIENVEALAGLLDKAGANGRGFAAWLEGEGGALHDKVIADAEASGIFGVPSYVIEGEIFWGGDRLPMVIDKLDAMGLRSSTVQKK